MNRFVTFTGGALVAATLSMNGCKSESASSLSPAGDKAPVAAGDQALENVALEITGMT